jgi:hypothetical protein
LHKNQILLIELRLLLFYAIPEEAQVANFESGILLFVIIATSLIMTWAMIKDKKKMNTLLDEIDEGYAERNEAEDLLREQQEINDSTKQVLPDSELKDKNTPESTPNS